MIIYVTKQTFERYKLKLPEDLKPPMNELAQAWLALYNAEQWKNWLFLCRRKVSRFGTGEVRR